MWSQLLTKLQRDSHLSLILPCTTQVRINEVWWGLPQREYVQVLGYFPSAVSASWFLIWRSFKASPARNKQDRRRHAKPISHCREILAESTSSFLRVTHVWGGG